MPAKPRKAPKPTVLRDFFATRRSAAVQSIGTFAKNHQVLFFTCHPEHAGELQSLAGARNLQVLE
jgi:uncharacterized protein YhaN